MEIDVSPEPDDDFSARVIANLTEIFWTPEIAARGGEDVVGPFVSGVALLPPHDEPRILLNDEVRIQARSRADAPVEPGTSLTLDNVDRLERLEPADLDPDHGWVLSTQMPDGSRYVAFDFRRNRGTGRRQLDLAEEYYATATDALAAGRVGPSLEAAFSAAELAITAMKHLSDWQSPRKGSKHRVRAEWLDQFTRLENAPRDLHACLDALNQVRHASRYGEAPLDVSAEDAAALVSPVARLIEHARLRVG